MGDWTAAVKSPDCIPPPQDHHHLEVLPVLPRGRYAGRCTEPVRSLRIAAADDDDDGSGGDGVDVGPPCMWSPDRRLARVDMDRPITSCCCCCCCCCCETERRPMCCARPRCASSMVAYPPSAPTPKSGAAVVLGTCCVSGVNHPSCWQRKGGGGGRRGCVRVRAGVSAICESGWQHGDGAHTHTHTHARARVPASGSR